MGNLRCCVVDDEPLALELIKSYILKTPFMEYVGGFTSATLAVKTIIENNIDVVFMDIQMAEINGVEFARVVPERCKVIFVTAYDKYAVQAFRVNALDYLLKPVEYSEFLAAANKALQWFQRDNVQKGGTPNEEEQCVIVKSEYKLIQIPMNRILYVEGLKDYVRIFLDDPDRQPVLSLMSLKSLEDALPPSKFMRIHRSYIVQLSKIRVIERNRIVFGKQYLPVSESYKDRFQEYLQSHSLVPIKEY